MADLLPVLIFNMWCWEKYIYDHMNVMKKMEKMNDVHDDDDDSEAWKGVGGQSLLGAPAGPGSH